MCGRDCSLGIVVTMRNRKPRNRDRIYGRDKRIFSSPKLSAHPWVPHNLVCRDEYQVSFPSELNGRNVELYLHTTYTFMSSFMSPSLSQPYVCHFIFMYTPKVATMKGSERPCVLVGIRVSTFAEQSCTACMFSVQQRLLFGTADQCESYLWELYNLRRRFSNGFVQHPYIFISMSTTMLSVTCF